MHLFLNNENELKNKFFNEKNAEKRGNKYVT